MIKLLVEPNTVPMSWQFFLKNSPGYSLALDGYVSDGPKYDWKNHKINLNHHENVDRMATLATCGQVLRSLRIGIFDTFTQDGTLTCNVFVNDCDEDVCTSVFILQNHELCLPVINPLVNRLVEVESILDATAGLYPFPKDMRLLRQLNWVYEPYRRFRNSQSFQLRNKSDFESVIEDVVLRITKYSVGDTKEIPLDTRYEKVGGGLGWSLVKEYGANARLGMIADGIKAFVSVRESANNFIYTIGKISEGIQFDIVGLFDVLNEAENCKDDKWGGGTTVGGSPRISGSQLKPDEIEKIVNEFIKNENT